MFQKQKKAQKAKSITSTEAGKRASVLLAGPSTKKDAGASAAMVLGSKKLDVGAVGSKFSALRKDKSKDGAAQPTGSKTRAGSKNKDVKKESPYAHIKSKSDFPQDPLCKPQAEYEAWLQDGGQATRLVEGREARHIQGVRQKETSMAADRFVEQKEYAHKRQAWRDCVEQLRGFEPESAPPTDYESIPHDSPIKLKPIEDMVLLIPDLFENFPFSKVAADHFLDEEWDPKEAQDEEEQDPEAECPDCGFKRWKGWGNARCYSCSTASELLSRKHKTTIFIGLVETEKQKHYEKPPTPPPSPPTKQRTKSPDGSPQRKKTGRSPTRQPTESGGKSMSRQPTGSSGEKSPGRKTRKTEGNPMARMDSLGAVRDIRRGGTPEK